MEHLKFYIVDVFAEKKYTGNQLAVFKNAGVLSDTEMQKIAREMNYSETTFILSEKQESFDVRIFTPEREVPFAGHPTLGTAYVIQKEIIKKTCKNNNFESKNWTNSCNNKQRCFVDEAKIIYFWQNFRIQSGCTGVKH